jgi:hypothetical protein
MEKPLDIIDSHLENDKLLQLYFQNEKSYSDTYSEEVSYRLPAEAGKFFFNYLKRFNLTGDRNLFVLPPANHYYYDKRELRRVRTLVNLRKLNLIDDINDFLNTLFLFLPPNANFVGCFSDSRTALKRDGLLSDLSTRLNNIIDSRTVHYLDKNNTGEILEKNGFKVVDMMETDELTYFYSQSVCKPL